MKGEIEMRKRIDEMYARDEYKMELVDEHEVRSYFEAGMKELERYATYRRRGFIQKSEYNMHRNAIEKHLLGL